MKIGILNSGGCNINSITFALNRLGVRDVVVVKSVGEFEECDKIIIPGVGHAKVAMGLLWEQNLIEVVRTTNKPVLGICLGMQIMFDYSEEGEVKCLGILPGKVVHLPKNITSPQMGWNRLIGGDYDGGFVYFANSYYVVASAMDPRLRGDDKGGRSRFALCNDKSFANPMREDEGEARSSSLVINLMHDDDSKTKSLSLVIPAQAGIQLTCLASYVEYEGIKVAAMIRKNNFFGCQFHPEKSGIVGQKILQKFINL